MRYTKAVIQQLLDQNEGFTRTTHDSQKNFSETRDYTISNGELHIRARGKTSWADSRFDNQSVATVEQARYFLKKFEYALNTDGLE